MNHYNSYVEYNAFKNLTNNNREVIKNTHIVKEFANNSLWNKKN